MHGNSSATNLFDILVIASPNDARFNQWLKCLSIIFGTTEDDIMTDYNNLRPLVQAEAENLTYYSYGMEFKEAKWITVRNGMECVSAEFKISYLVVLKINLAFDFAQRWKFCPKVKIVLKSRN